MSVESAKARQWQNEAAASSSSDARNPNNKRPVEVTASSGSPTVPRPLKRDARLGKYFEYDLSKMVNSKGGFLVEDEKEVDQHKVAIEKQRENERAQQNVDPRTCSCILRSAIALYSRLDRQLAMFLDRSKNPQCHDCGSVDIDHSFRKIFNCLVCNKCKNEKPEKYSLLTKTECKEVGLLNALNACC